MVAPRFKFRNSEVIEWMGGEVSGMTCFVLDSVSVGDYWERSSAEWSYIFDLRCLL